MSETAANKWDFENRDAILNIINPTPPEQRDELYNITDISSFYTHFQNWKKSTSSHLLIKIQLNPTAEVIRLNEEDGLNAETIMIKVIEDIILNNFQDGLVAKVSFNSFMVILQGDYSEHENNLHKFADEFNPLKIKINGTIYFPKFLIGITTLGDKVGESFSRLELAITKATAATGRASWYVASDCKEYQKYRENRLGLRQVRNAINQKELGLYAQPIISLDTEKPNLKYEVLLRHYQNKTDVSSPLQILNFAEFNKISQDIDFYVMNLLCENFHRLCANSTEEIETISVNLSGSSFTSPKFFDIVNNLILKYNIPKEKLILEITEDIANHDASEAIKTMEKFRSVGFKMALDDIGIGSSNFKNLYLFPVDYFKIDRSYCEEILGNLEIRSFVQLIINVGKKQGKKIVAEGIPNIETLELLREMGADYSQSFLTAMPEEFIIAPKYDHSITGF
jgi:EAL domain-containing protein (putative c-di-GMP-specific phosphodiesterase class I)